MVHTKSFGILFRQSAVDERRACELLAFYERHKSLGAACDATFTSCVQCGTSPKIDSCTIGRVLRDSYDAATSIVPNQGTLSEPSATNTVL